MEKQIKTIKIFFQKDDLLKEFESIENYDWIETSENHYQNEFYNYLQDLKRVYMDILVSKKFNTNIQMLAQNNFEKIIETKREILILKKGVDTKELETTRDKILKKSFSNISKDFNFNNELKKFNEKFYDVDIEIVKTRYVITDYNNESHKEIMHRINNDLLPLVSEFIGKCNSNNMGAELEWGYEESLKNNFKIHSYIENWNELNYETLNQNYFCLKALQRDVNRFINDRKTQLIESEIENDFDNYEGNSVSIDCASIHKIIIDNLVIELENYIIAYKKANTIESNPEPKQEKTKREKPLKKFEFNATYESIERIFQLLINSGFINPANSNNIGAILRDTFLKYDEESGNYKPIDNKVFNTSTSKSRDKNEVIDIKNKPINIKSNSDYTKFTTLLKELNKIIPENKQ